MGEFTPEEVNSDTTQESSNVIVQMNYILE